MDQFKIHRFLYVTFVVIQLISFNACTEELVAPMHNTPGKNLLVTARTSGPVSIQLVKLKVSLRDHIPIEEILTCSYIGETTQGFWEYHLTTLNNGPKIYVVTQIIGDDFEGA